jgi:hypothetical protein
MHASLFLSLAVIHSRKLRPPLLPLVVLQMGGCGGALYTCRPLRASLV